MIKGKLKNNIEYIIQNNNNHVSTTIIVFFKVGSRNETSKFDGISHYIEHMMFKGTHKRPNPTQIVNALYRYGAKINAFTDRDNTGYYVKITPEHLDKAMDILSDMIFNSRFTEKDLKVEKKVVLNELERYASEPNKQIDQMICRILYKDTTLEHDIGGNEDDINNYTRDMTMSYLDNYYTTDNMLISIVGKINKNILIKLNKYFGNKKFNYKPKHELIHNNQTIYFPNLRNMQKGIRFNSLIRTDLKQAYVCVAIPTFSFNDDRSYIVDVIGTLLAGNMGSRLFVLLREKLGLVYNVRKDIDKFEDCGSLKINFSTFNINGAIKKCYKTIIKEFNDLKKKLVSNKELDYVKDYMIGTLQLSKENTKNGAIFFGLNMMFMGKPHGYEYFVDKYRQVTPQDIYNVANQIFQINKLNMSIISQHNIFDD